MTEQTEQQTEPPEDRLTKAVRMAVITWNSVPGSEKVYGDVSQFIAAFLRENLVVTQCLVPCDADCASPCHASHEVGEKRGLFNDRRRLITLAVQAGHRATLDPGAYVGRVRLEDGEYERLDQWQEHAMKAAVESLMVPPEPTPDPTACACVPYTIRTDYGTGIEHDLDTSSCPVHGPGCCMACNGKGETSEGPCSDCYGTGHIHPEDVSCITEPEPDQWRYFVRDTHGQDYAVGTWKDGKYIPGTREDAEREHTLLGEPGAYVWGRQPREGDEGWPR